MKKTILILALIVLVPVTPAMAGDVAGLTSFTSNTPALASEVNGNFTSVKTAVDDNNGRIAALEALVAALQADVTTLKSDVSTLKTEVATLKTETASLKAKTQYMSVEAGILNDLAGPHVIFQGVNVHVRNDKGSTATTDGLGNLIVGYNEVMALPPAGYRDGSHDLVVGALHSYPSYGGLVIGYENKISGAYSSVSGGNANQATGDWASVSGGYMNVAGGNASSVSGGSDNTAGNFFSAVSGGKDNQATQSWGTVSGGRNNTASGQYSVVSGEAGHNADEEDEHMPVDRVGGGDAGLPPVL